MKIHLVEIDDVHEWVVSGDLDAASCVLLDDAITKSVAAGCRKIIVNCTQLEYMSSAGMGVFMSHIEEFSTQNIAMVIVGLNERIAYNFKVLGLAELLHLTHTIQEAKRVVNELYI